MATKLKKIELRKPFMTRRTLVSLTRWRGSVLLLGVVLFLVMAAFLNSLLRLPTRTPLLIVSSTYQAPWDINPWQDSNATLMQKLGNHSYRVKSIEATGRSIAHHWIKFEEEISQLDRAAPKGKPILIYLNLHGTVDPQENPCLVYRDSSPLATDSWIPFGNILLSIENALSQPREIVFLCESGRLETPWQSSRAFPEALQHLFATYPKSEKILSLSGICTTHPTPFENIKNETGDRFTRLLAMGLAGLCDQKQHGGNSNRLIELEELQSYIENHFCGVKPTPSSRVAYTKLLATEPSKTSLGWAGINNPYSQSELPVANKPLKEDLFHSVWRDVEAAKVNRVWLNHPAYWSLLKQTAIDMEALLHSYNPDTDRMAELQRTFERLKLKCNEPILPPETRPDVFLQRQINQGLDFWQELSVTPNANTLRKKLDRWEFAREELQYHPAPFLKALMEQKDENLFQQSDVLKSFANGMIALETARLKSLQLPSLLVYEEQEKKLDANRRELEDRLLAGLLDRDTSEKLKSFERDCASFEKWTSSTASALVRYYESIAELMPLVKACLIVDRFEANLAKPNPQPHESELRKSLRAFIKELTGNTEYLTASIERSHNGSFEDVGNAHQKLKDSISSSWAKLLGDGHSLSNEHSLAIAQLLNSGFLPQIEKEPNSTNSIRHGSYRALRNHAAAELSDAPNLLGPNDENPVASNHDVHPEMNSLLAPLYDQVFRGLVPSDKQASQPLAFWKELQRLHVSGNVKVEGSLIQQSIAARLLTSQFGLPECGQWIHTFESRLEERRAVNAINRHLQDFWNLPDRNGTPFFVRASEMIKSKIEQMPANATPYATETFAKIAIFQKAAKQFQLATRYLPTSTNNLSPHLSWSIKNNSEDLPFTFGMGTVKLINVKNDNRELIDRQLVSGNLAQSELAGSFSLSNRINSTSDNDVLVRFDYRGHRCEESLAIHESPKLISLVSSSPIGEASVRIEETGNSKRYRTLILDCSASMFEAYDLELPPTTNSNSIDKSKLYAAKRAVSEILERWEQEQIQVGVLFFGHRVSAAGEKQSNLIQDKYFVSFPFSPTLQPYEDVETVLPVGRFTTLEKSAVLNHLAPLLPWGQSPLYLALYQAIQQASAVTHDGTHDVIVISDGRNYQFNPNPSANIAIDSVIELAKSHKARIHLIGFGIPKTEFAEASEQYHRLASETGGSATFQVADSVALVERVNSLSAPQSVAIHLPNNERILATSGTDISLPIVTQNNTPITVEYNGISNTFPISPKSALKLFVSVDNKFSSAQYTASGAPNLHSLIDVEQNISSVQLGVHPPHRLSEGYAWDLSLIDINGGVPPRPKYHLVSIEPQWDREYSSRSEPSPKYISFNSNWLPNTPNPVLQVHTKNWPENSHRANLHFWCTDETPSILAQWSWDDQKLARPFSEPAKSESSSEATQETLIHDLPDLGLRCHAYATNREIVLVVFHESDELNPEDILPLATLGSAPERTERDYRPIDKMSIHRFFWHDHKVPSLKSQTQVLKIALLNLTEMKKVSLYPIKPIATQIAQPMTAKPTSPSPIIRR